jgi:uncharacterized protein
MLLSLTVNVRVWLLALLLGIGLSARAGEVIPPSPPRYFNDYANIIPPLTATEFNKMLEAYEKTNSSQIVVAIFPRMQSNSSIEDYTHRVFQAWKVGQKGKDNGVVLFVFLENRTMRVEVGYGLEGAIPDAIGKRIIEEQIKPHFQKGDFTAGARAGIISLMQAARGEYKGTGRTVAQNKGGGRRRGVPPGIGLLFLILMVYSIRHAAARGTVYHRRGRSGWSGFPTVRGSTWSGGGWGGGWTGGGSSSGGSWGGFSGGGGRSGGGGASGSW